MNWMKISITTTSMGAEILSPLLEELGITGCQIQDPADFRAFLENKTLNWDYIEDSLLSLREGDVIVTVYLARTAQGNDSFLALKQRLELLRQEDADNLLGKLELFQEEVAEEDWATSWKSYYHPTPVGERLLIRPSWEECPDPRGRIVLTLDPGMAFGTGTHESTALCLSLLERAVTPGCRILDVGTGSGILAIAGLLLGAGEALGVDIDAVAVKVAEENAALNQVQDKARFLAGDLTDQASGRYHVICANIVADVIIRLLPSIGSFLEEGGTLIVSGIIDTRLEDVEAALEQNGLQAAVTLEEGGWAALACRRKGEAEHAPVL